MNYLAAIFIIVMPTDYEAFICLTHIMQTMNWRCIYFTNTPKLTNLIEVLQKRIHDECPEVYEHLESHEVTNLLHNQLFNFRSLQLEHMPSFS